MDTQPSAPQRRSPAIAVLVALIALLIGLAGGYGLSFAIGDRNSANETRSTTGLTRADLDDRESELNEMADKLDERQDAIEAEEVKLKKNTIPTDAGMLIVGEDVRPGAYRAANATDECYWARLASLDTDDFITAGNGPGQIIVTIKASDKAFETTGCPDFRKID